VHRGRASDVGDGEKNDAVVVFSEAEVEGAGALVVGRLERGDGEAGRGREGLAGIGDEVDEGLKEWCFGPPKEWVTSDSRKATSIPMKPAWLRIVPLTYSAAATTPPKVRVLGLTPIHTRSGQNASSSASLAKPKPSTEVHMTPQEARYFSVSSRILGPGVCDRTVADRAQLADVGLRFCTLALGPGRTRLEDAGSPAGRTIEVSESVGVMVGEH
jgi:hypothetical protein